jgi:hypothetical protein
MVSIVKQCDLHGSRWCMLEKTRDYNYNTWGSKTLSSRFSNVRILQLWKLWMRSQEESKRTVPRGFVWKLQRRYYFMRWLCELRKSDVVRWLTLKRLQERIVWFVCACGWLSTEIRGLCLCNRRESVSGAVVYQIEELTNCLTYRCMNCMV